jgi:hypothetical protein
MAFLRRLETFNALIFGVYIVAPRRRNRDCNAKSNCLPGPEPSGKAAMTIGDLKENIGTAAVPERRAA